MNSTIRVLKQHIACGLTGAVLLSANELVLRSAVVKEAPQGFYHPDYRAGGRVCFINRQADKV